MRKAKLIEKLAKDIEISAAYAAQKSLRALQCLTKALQKEKFPIAKCRILPKKIHKALTETIVLGWPFPEAEKHRFKKVFLTH